MYISLRCVLACLSVGSAAVHGPPRLPNKGVVANNEVITRDFAIIGGGSSGTYSALRLKDLNHTVVVVEKKNVLGGHTETYVDPSTNGTFDIGVQVFYNTTTVKNYFSRFDIPLVAAVTSVPGGTTENVDLRTGAIANITTYSLAEIQAGLTAYGTQLAQYSYLEAGYYLPDEIPSDLLLPFGEFATKYNLGSVVSIIAAYGQGLGSVTDHTTLAVMKRVSLSVLGGIINGYLTAASGNHQLYDRALESLGSDVLLNSDVLLVSRSDFNKTGYVTVVVCTPTGIKTIHAKRIILTIPPKLANLGGFDLDITETSILGQFNNSGYYTGIIGNTGLPALLSINNVSPESFFQLPEIPGVFNIVPTGLPGLFSVKYGSPNSTGLSDSYVQNDIIQALNRYQAQNNIPTTTPNFAIYSAHFPFDLTVSAEQIKAGFYKDLYALQGHNNMFYNGAAFHTYDSSALWEFTESLLPTFTAGL